MKLHVLATKQKGNTYYEHLIRSDDCLDFDWPPLKSRTHMKPKSTNRNIYASAGF